MQLQTFKYQGEKEQLLKEVKTIEIDGEIWFVAMDVCKALEISNIADAVSRLDYDERLTSVLPISGQSRNVNLINESGLCTLVFKSRKPLAHQFRKWITREVIPSMRTRSDNS
ncbi:MAG: Bro-N domain-containing protein [Tannerella sp.]|jgi:prophage antirepressor-like protein|nr:Bro-N domain-containing protein [Tannerella sp.]